MIGVAKIYLGSTPNEYSQSYWMQVAAISGEKNEFPQDSSVVIIGRLKRQLLGTFPT